MNPGDRIEQDARSLALPRGRRVGQPGHQIAQEYLRHRLTEIGLLPFADGAFDLPFTRAHPDTGLSTRFVNLVARIPGTGGEKPPILVGAHYDSVMDSPCADDNATAVAVALAIAERFAQTTLRHDLVIGLFDSEEPPFFLTEAMGSTRFYQDHCAGIGFGCVIIMDLIGHDVEVDKPGVRLLFPGLKDLLFVLGSESARMLPEIVEQAAARVEHLRVVPTLNSYVGDMSDHHAFRLGGEPYLFLSCGQGRYYHDPKDDMNWVNLAKVRRVFHFVTELIEAADSRDLSHDRQPCDPVDFEIRMIKRALGIALPIALKGMGIPGPTSRSDMDQLVGLLAHIVRV